MIYLDYAAATPVSKKALDAMLPFFSDNFFNPSAIYYPAKEVRSLYEDAKNRIAHTIGAKGNDLIITSGATEATNLAFTCLEAIIIQNSAENQPKTSKCCKNYNISATPVKSSKSAKKSLILETEHSSVLEVAKKYDSGLIKVNKFGEIDLKDFEKKLSDDIVLVSISLVNNELGTIQPFSEISEIIKNARLDRLKRGIKTPLYLHTDASQALNLLDVNISRLGVDLMTLNSAKIYGPKGVGALYASHDVRLAPVIFGGGQENGLRSGTENVPAVLGFAAAAEEAKSHISSNRKNFASLKSLFIKQFADFPHEVIFLGNQKSQLSSFIPVSFPGLDAERLIFKLEDQGIYVSTGAACSANKGKKSHVLAAIGLEDAEIAGSLRISLGSHTTQDDVLKAATALKTALEEEHARKNR